MLLPPYTCICCGYDTRHKPAMRRHLYNRRSCPKVLNDIQMTDEIREYILENRVYHIPKLQDQHKTINQTINNIHTVNNFVQSLDVLEKLASYTKYKSLPVINAPDSIRDKLQHSIKSLEYQPSTPEHVDPPNLSKENLMNIVRDVSTSVKDLQDFNIIYDTKYDEILIFEDDAWQHYTVQTGLDLLFHHIQDCFLNAYEIYLVRRMYAASTKYQERARCKELLTEYYKFLAAFNINAYVQGKNDFQIKYPATDPKHHTYVSPNDPLRYEIDEAMMKIYRSCKDSMKDVEKLTFKRNILGILKVNTLKNIKELDKRVSSLFNMDEEFKKLVLRVGDKMTW